MSLCPSPETLGRLASNSSSVSRFSAMEAHVEGCPECQGVLERLAADSWVSEAHRLERLPPREQPPTIPGFVIERELGRGGMGVVYQAWQPQLARRVAIKVVSVGVGIGAEERERWLREAQAIARLRHRNVVQLHEAGEQDGCLYLVLDLIPGGSLADRVSGPLPTRVAVGLMATVARAVEYIHQAGLVHLDIKPSNILLDGPLGGHWDQVTPMVTDFGIARAGDDPSATANNGSMGVRGTPSYMAPEQITGDRAAIICQSDVFALGATLYSLLTGQPPFQATTVIGTLDQVRTHEPTPPGTIVPGLPRDLETITLTCLRKDPRGRYASAAALAEDLQRWLDGFPIRARPVSKLEHAARWCRRRPAFAILLAILAITLTSSLLGLFTLWRHSEAERARAEHALARAVTSDNASSSAVRELVGLLTTNVDTPQMLTRERISKSSQVVRDLTCKLRKDRALALPNLILICDLERQLAEDFRRRSQYRESRELLLDALTLVDGRRSHTTDPAIEVAYARILLDLGHIAYDQECYEEALIDCRRAEKALEALVHVPERLEAVVLLDGVRRFIATLLRRDGLEELRREVMESHIRMLDGLNAHFGEDPALSLLAVLARSDLASGEGASTQLRAAILRFPANQRLPELFESRVADWIAFDINPFPSDPDTIGEPRGRLDPETRAIAIIKTLESRCEALSVYPAILPLAAYRVAVLAAGRGATQRKTGHLDDASRTSACLSAFANTLAQRDPNEPSFHLLLCEAFEQEGKMAWKGNDYVAIEAAWRKALGQAHDALLLDPQSNLARLKVAGLQDKLIGLASEPLSSR